MAVLSDTAAQALLKGLVGDDASPLAPATFYVGLSSTEPTIDDGDIITVTEPTNGSYARVAVANTDAKWSISGRSAKNVDEIQFPTVTAVYDETPAYFVVFDAATAGDALFAGALNKSFSLSVGVKLVLAEEAVVLSVEE